MLPHMYPHDRDDDATLLDERSWTCGQVTTTLTTPCERKGAQNWEPSCS